MPTLLNCSCGKTVRAADEHAGKRVRCPGCAAVLSVPAAPPPAASDDFEVLEDEPAPAPPAKPTRLKAAVAEEPPAPASEPENPFAKLATKKKKQKKKKKDSPVDDDDAFERAEEAQKRLARTARGVAYIAIGLLVFIGCVYIYLNYWEDVKSTGGKSVLGLIVFGVMGLAAIGKGVIGLALGQFLGDEE